MATIRTFIAIELDDTLKARLEKVQQRLRGEPISGFVRWVAPGGIHLTLKFLGDMDSARTPQVLAAMQTACAGIEPFELAVRSTGCFPNWQRPNVIWVGLTGQVQVVSQLAQKMEEQCAKLGFNPDERPFSPHLTLGRVRREMGQIERGQLGELVRKLDIGQLGLIHADIVHLMCSELKPHGAVYSSLGSVKLV
jgi:RNA 2',3'-cyclic 3'-phosphodiesterase